MKFALLTALALLSSPAFACESPTVSIEGANATEKQAACDALAKMNDYFLSLGIAAQAPTIKFLFEQQVRLPSQIPEERIPVHGYFDTDDNSIHTTQFASESQTARRPWGLPWTEKMAGSILLHEVSHLYAISHQGSSFRELAHHWHEFLAYSIQIDLLDEETKKELLANYPNATPFSDPGSVNSFFYESEPELYAVRAYLSTHAWGGKKFIADLLKLNVKEARRSAF